MNHVYKMKTGYGKPGKQIQLIYSKSDKEDNIESQQYRNGTNADVSETDSSTAK